MDHNRYSKIYAYQGQTAQKYLNKKIFLIDKDIQKYNQETLDPGPKWHEKEHGKKSCK